MKKIFVVLLLLVSIFISFSIYYSKIHDTAQLSETTLLKAFNNSGAKIVNSEVYFWGKLGSEYNNSDKLKYLAEDISKKLGVIKNNAYSIKSIGSDTIQKIELKGMLSDNKYVDIITQSDKVNNSDNERFISINLTQDLSGTGLDELKQQVLKVFENYGISPKVNTCITGYLDGKLQYDQLNDISKKVFKQAEASDIEGVRDQNLISVAAYSPIIDDYIRVNGKKVNLNLAIRYNSYENRTYIWLATPVISIEY